MGRRLDRARRLLGEREAPYPDSDGAWAPEASDYSTAWRPMPAPGQGAAPEPEVPRAAPSAGPSGPPSGPPTVAAVVGTRVIDPVVVGDPSPMVESQPTAEKYRSQPYRPDTVVDGWSTDEFTVRAASLRGHVHRHDGAPRQDDLAVHALPSGRVVVAVADGVSSALHAHVASTAVVRQTVQWIVTHAPDVGDRIDWDELVHEAAYALVAQATNVLKSDGAPDLAEVERLFATTLVVAAVDPEDDGASAQIAGIGDSGAWILCRDRIFESVLGGKRADDGGITSSAVSGLPRRPDTVVGHVITIEADEVLLIGTDGFGDPLGGGTGGVGDLFRGLLGRPTPPSPTEFAHALDFSREGFDDDRTLVAVRCRQEPERR